METRYYGKYRAIVRDVDDPERRGRIRVECTAVLGTSISAWCEPCIPYATDFAGDFYVPPVNEGIWVEFEEGDPNKPIWNGGWYRIDSSPLQKDSKQDQYRYIVFKDSVLRMSDREFIFELRDGDKSYTVTINSSTWKGLNYIGSKSEDELNDLENLIQNRKFLLEDFPKEVQENFKAIEEQLKNTSDVLTHFINEAYNPFVQSTGDALSAIEGVLIADGNALRDLDQRVEALEHR